MSPVAAHLSKGLEILALGEVFPEEELIVLENLEPEYHEDEKVLDGLILYIDGFGNLITNIPLRELEVIAPPFQSLMVFRWKGQRIPALRTATFAGNDENMLLLIEGSSGLLEICYNQGNAAKELGAHIGNTFQLEMPQNDAPTIPGLNPE